MHTFTSSSSRQIDGQIELIIKGVGKGAEAVSKTGQLTSTYLIITLLLLCGYNIHCVASYTAAGRPVV